MIKYIESYHDLIVRLYPETTWQKHQIADITFQITDDCNLRCSYCYQINKGHHKMSLETAKTFIDLILQPSDQTKQYLNSLESTAVVLDFIGGEPFLEVELIDQIATYFVEQCILLNHPWQYHFILSISTNGTLYFTEKVQQFLKKWNYKLSLSISIDGNKTLHDSCRLFPNGTGSYDIAIEAVRHYRKNYEYLTTLGSKMTLSPENILYTKDAVINLINEGYIDIFLNCIYEQGWDYSHATILYQQLKELSDYLLENNLYDNLFISIFQEDIFKPKSLTDTTNWCGGNGDMIAIDYKGDIYPCLRYMESSLGTDVPPIIVGNIKTGIMTTKEQIEAGKTIQAVNRITQSTNECLYCPIADGCSWCQAYNYQCSGNVNKRATYICCMHKARALANCYFWNKYYRKINDNHHRFKLWLPDQECLKIISQNELQLLHQLERK